MTLHMTPSTAFIQYLTQFIRIAYYYYIYKVIIGHLDGFQPKLSQSWFKAAHVKSFDFFNKTN